MPNEPLSTQNYVQIGDKVLNRTADASITTNDVSLSDRVFVFKKNEDGSIKTVVNTTIQYIVDAFSADATAIKNNTKEYCDGIKADTSQLKADTEALKNAAVTAKTSAESARDSAISAKNSASTSATNASNSASSASASATTATTKASEASASASSASKSATSASTSASNASSSASSASASATSASNSASTATAKASEASTSANQAKGYRDEAQAFRDEINPESFATKADVSSASVEDRKWANITGKPSSYNPAGTVIWYSGKSLPSGYLVCNGQSLNKTTYANLFNAIGYTYGGSGNSFNVPNLSDGNGRFIRATTDFSKVGTKQDDAIRNITGRTSAGSDSTNYDGTAGAFYQGSTKESRIGSLSSWGSRYTYRFDANSDNRSMGNPMAGHANGADIHPYNISLVPLIAY